MTRVMIFDIETNERVGEKEIPDDVLEAAAKVSDWMHEHEVIELHGLRLAD
jgi:hypothetical protein